MRSSANMLRLAGAAILLLASAPAFAGDTAREPSDAATADHGAAPAAAKPEAKPAKERKICRTEAASELRLGAKKICMTAKQWRDRQG